MSWLLNLIKGNDLGEAGRQEEAEKSFKLTLVLLDRHFPIIVQYVFSSLHRYWGLWIIQEWGNYCNLAVETLAAPRKQ